ncbi:hypothetical protein AMECASPLE_020569, partial [Ameca splendens]
VSDSPESILWHVRKDVEVVRKLWRGAFPNAYLTPKEQITAATALISSHHDIKHRG